MVRSGLDGGRDRGGHFGAFGGGWIRGQESLGAWTFWLGTFGGLQGLGQRQKAAAASHLNCAVPAGLAA